MKIETWYEIAEVSRDGLIKWPQKCDYGQHSCRFPDRYLTMDEVDKAILESGEQYEDYFVLTVKRCIPEPATP